MEEEKRNIPEVRFREFAGVNADAWELRKFGDILEFSVSNNNLSRSKLNYTNGNVKNVHYGDILVKFDSILNADNPQIPYINENEIKNYGKDLLIDGDIVIADTAEDETTGKAVEIYGTKNTAIVSGLHTIVARTKIKFASYYLGYYMNSYSYHKQLLPLMQGIKVLSLSKANISKTILCYPKILKEQQKIGTLFKHLDSLITLHQRELDNLKALKKTLLSKMFPKNYEKYPEIRFSGFTDAWELRRIGECFDERSSRSENGELISVTINSGVIKANELDRKDISSSNKTNYKVVHTGDIAYNSMRMWQGASGYSPYEGILSPAYTVIKPKENIYSKFFAQYFKRNDVIWLFRINSQGLTSDTWNLKFPALSRIYLNVPNIDEQIKIANYFELLDSLITLHQRELDNLKILKKTLLSKMFV